MPYPPTPNMGPGLPWDPDGQDYVQPLTSYRPMNQMAGQGPVVGDVGPGKQEGGGINAGGVAGLASLIAAAIAGPDSSIGNLLHGGVTQYANNQMRKQLDTDRLNHSQHEALVKTIYAKVPELSRMAPEHPGVQELQKLWAEALADDQVISPKEAADISAKIHAIEGSVGEFGEKAAAGREATSARIKAQELQDAQTFQLVQAATPGLQGMSFEDAKKAPWFREMIDHTRAQEFQRGRQNEDVLRQTVPQEINGQQVQVPALTAYKETMDREGAKERAGIMANTRTQGFQATDNRFNTKEDNDMASQIMAMANTRIGRNKLKEGSRTYDPEFAKMVMLAKAAMARGLGGGENEMQPIPQAGQGLGFGPGR